MAVDTGLSGTSWIVLGALGGGTTGVIDQLDVRLMSALSGSIVTSGVGCPPAVPSIGAAAVLPPVPFGGVTGGTLVLSPGGGGGGSADASTSTSSSPGPSGTAVTAIQNAPSGPTGPSTPAPPGGGPTGAGTDATAPAPDQQTGGGNNAGGGSVSIADQSEYFFNYNRDGVLTARVASQSQFELRCKSSYKEYLEGRQALKEIYQEYGRIYLQDPATQVWAGLAVHAGSVVLVDIYDQIERQQQAWLCNDEGMSDLCDQLQRLTLAMARAIRDDVGKQSSVFAAEGIEGIQGMGLDRANLNAWESIARGDVWAGAEYLTKREQTDVLNPFYAELARLWWALKPAFTLNAKSGLEGFGCPSFSDAMGYWPWANWTDSDEAAKNDRWKYIRDCLLPVWQGMGEEQRTDWVQQRLEVIRTARGAFCEF